MNQETNDTSGWGWIKNNRIKSIIITIGAILAFTAALAETTGFSFRDFFSTEDSGNNSSAADGHVGWGPVRTTYSMASGGAPFPAFNCIIDNPNYGNELNFASVRDVTSGRSGDFQDHINVMDNHKYEIRILVNNCGPDGDIEARSSWIQDAKVTVGTPSGDDRTHIVTAKLTSSNAADVWDDIEFFNEKPFHFTYEDGGAVLYSNAHPLPDGLPLESDIFTRHGHSLGYEDMDGNIRPGYQYVNYVYVTLGVQEVD